MIKTENYIIDRIEDGIATIETASGEMINISTASLPENSKAGDCLIFEENSFKFSQIETNLRKSRIKSLLDGLVNKK